MPGLDGVINETPFLTVSECLAWMHSALEKSPDSFGFDLRQFLAWAHSSGRIPGNLDEANSDTRRNEWLLLLDEFARLQWGESTEEFSHKTNHPTPRGRAEDWLRVIAEKNCYWADAEALVYLVSRKHECDDLIQKLVADWKESEKRAIRIARASQGENPSSELTQALSGTTTDILSPERALSFYTLRNFWGFAQGQELSIDATMMRAVEWCRIVEFNPWFERYAREYQMDIIKGGIAHPISAGFSAFNYCRSNLAIKLLRETLASMLHAMLSPERGMARPWHIHELEIEGLEPVQDFEIERSERVGVPEQAAYILFVAKRLGNHTINDQPIGDALDYLITEQSSRGSWKSIHETEPVITTATCVHALAAWKPAGWQLHVKRAAEWLWTQQHSDGYWPHDSAPDVVYLTVLVLDAIDLAEGRDNVTFDLQAEDDSANSTHGRVVPELPIADEELLVIRYNRQDYKASNEGARMVKLLVENIGEWVAMGKNDFTKPSDVRKSLPEPIQSLIESEKGKGYRIKNR